MPHLPIINRLVNTDYRFVSLDGLYVKDGYEKELVHLVSCVLKRCGVYSSIINPDPNSVLYEKFKSISLGITHQIFGEKQFDVVAKRIQKNYNESDLPVYIPAFDVM